MNVEKSFLHRHHLFFLISLPMIIIVLTTLALDDQIFANGFNQYHLLSMALIGMYLGFACFAIINKNNTGKYIP